MNTKVDSTVLEFLEEIQVYFEDRADADHNGVSFVGNEEMDLMTKCEYITNYVRQQIRQREEIQ